MTFGAWRPPVLVLYLCTTPDHAGPAPSIPTEFPMAIRRSPSLRTVAAALLLVSALAGCKAGK
ncbi:MAG: hypothetical protein KBE68_02185, partial [Pseudoxanthomonas sp.]|nr:hypothetical protein [Pseudoxanthomonas sp.]